VLVIAGSSNLRKRRYKMFRKGDFVRGIVNDYILNKETKAKVIGGNEKYIRVKILEHPQEELVGDIYDVIPEYCAYTYKEKIKLTNPKILGKYYSSIVALLRKRKISERTILLKMKLVLEYMEKKFKEGKGIYLLAWTFCGKKGAGLPAMKIQNFVNDLLEIETKVYETQPVPAHISGDWCTPWLTRQCKSGIGLSTQKLEEEDYPYIHIITLLELPPLSLQ